jgi:phage host-nuclease inhibitor protein Gam
MKNKKQNRIKLAARAIDTRAEMEALVGEISALQLELNRETAGMDLLITEIRKRYEGTIDSLNAEIQAKTQLAQIWADTHPDEFPRDKKSIDFVHAIVGFRTGTPKVMPVRKSFTVKSILDLLSHFVWSKKYIRHEPTIDKEAILADRKTLTEQQLKEVGLKIVQDESFYIDLKATETDTTIKKDAA